MSARSRGRQSRASGSRTASVAPAAGGSFGRVRVRAPPLSAAPPARAGKRHFRPLSALRAHTKAPYEIGLLWKTMRTLKRRGRARTVLEEVHRHVVALGASEKGVRLAQKTRVGPRIPVGT